MNTKLIGLASLLVLLSCTACKEDAKQRDPDQDGATSNAANDARSSAAWKDGFVRTDGFYHGAIGKVVYVMRYFPEGHVMLLGGMTDDPLQLAAQLKAGAVTGPTTNIHQVPVEVRGDSLFFVTSGIKGEIDYFGHRRSADTLVFRKYSHITGRDATLPYVFQADASGPQ